MGYFWDSMRDAGTKDGIRLHSHKGVFGIRCRELLCGGLGQIAFARIRLLGVGVCTGTRESLWTM